MKTKPVLVTAGFPAPTEPGKGLASLQSMDALMNRGFELSPEASCVYGQSSTIQGINNMLGEVAGTDMPVLLLGESGTGKEVYARLIHRLSARKHVPLKKLSCAVVEPGQLLVLWNSYLREVSETAADEIGTVYLDGVDELDLACQKALLSVLSEGEMDGGQHYRVRLLCSASPVLDSAIESGRFRRELLFRINGVVLRLPPLRERKEDIPALMESLLSKHATELRKSNPILNEHDWELLRAHDWPGNIRELGNLAKRIVVLGDPATAIAELRSSPRVVARSKEAGVGSSLKIAARAASRQAERELILKALERTHWNRKRAAQDLQISYKSLLCKIKQTGVGDAQMEEE